MGEQLNYFQLELDAGLLDQLLEYRNLAGIGWGPCGSPLQHGAVEYNPTPAPDYIAVIGALFLDCVSLKRRLLQLVAVERAHDHFCKDGGTIELLPAGA